MNHAKLWTKDFIIIFGTNFFTHVVFYLLITTITLYVTTRYHTSQWLAGLTAGIFIIAALIARFIAGMYMDRIGRKNALIGSLLVYVIAMFLHLEANSLAFLLVLRFIQGAAFGFITTVAGAIAADLIPNKRRGEGTGYYATAMNVAMAIGPFLGIFISAHANFTIVVLVGGIIALIDLFTTILLKVPKVEIQTELLTEKPGFKLTNVIEPTSIPISITIFAVGLGYSSILSFLSTYAKEIHLQSVGSYFFLVYAIAVLSFRPFTGRWFDQFGANVVTYPLMILLALGFLFLSFAQNSFLFLFAAALIGIGFGTVQSNFQAIAIKRATTHRKSLATSTYFIFLDLATGSGPYLLGILVGWLGFRHLYIIVSIWIMVGMGLYYVMHGRKAEAKRRTIDDRVHSG